MGRTRKLGSSGYTKEAEDVKFLIICHSYDNI